MKHTTRLCVLALASGLVVQAVSAQGQENAGQEQTVAFMRITDQDAAASRLLGRGKDGQAYLAFRKTERLCVAFLKRYPKGEYAVDVQAVLRFSREGLDQLGESDAVQRELREAALEQVPAALVPAAAPRVAARRIAGLSGLRPFPLAGEPPGSQRAGALSAVRVPPRAPVSEDLRVPGLLALRPCAPMVVGTVSAEWLPWRKLPACGSGEARPLPGKPDALSALSVLSLAPVSSDQGVAGFLGVRPFRPVVERAVAPGGGPIARALEGLDALAAAPDVQDRDPPGLLPVRLLPSTDEGPVSPPRSRVASTLEALNAPSSAPATADLRVPDGLDLRPLSCASPGGTPRASVLEGPEALPAAPASRPLPVPSLLSTQAFPRVGGRVAAPTAGALEALSASPPMSVSDDLSVPGLFGLRSFADAAVRVGSSGGPQVTGALDGLAMWAAAPGTLDFGVPRLLGARPLASIDQDAALPVTSRTERSLAALSTSAPGPVSDGARVPAQLALRPFRDAVVRGASPSGLPLAGLAEVRGPSGLQDLGVPDLLNGRPLPAAAERAIRPAAALEAVDELPRATVSGDLGIPDLLSLRAFPASAVPTASRPGPRVASALEGLTAWTAASVLPDRPAPGLLPVEPLRPARGGLWPAASPLARGLALATLSPSVLPPVGLLGGRALGGAPELLRVAASAGGAVPVDGPARAFDLALSRRLAGTYYDLGKFFDDVDDVETGALMYREAVALGPHGARHFRLACRALARAYRRARDRPGLDWLASTLEAGPDAEPWAQELARRIRPRRP